MFVRRKLNKSGSISVQLIDKGRGQYKVVRTFGVAHTDYEADLLENKARQYLKEMTGGQLSLFAEPSEGLVEEALSNVKGGQVQVAGPELIFGEIYNRMGFGAISGKFFRHMVISRICEGGSKLRDIDYLQKSLGMYISAGEIYQVLDGICFAPKASGGNIQTAIERFAAEHAKAVSGSEEAFYVLTQLGFEAPTSDDLAKAGFSKEKKVKCPQLFVGLLMTSSGTPVTYDIFKSDAFKGGKMATIVKRVADRHGYKHPTVIADSPLLTRANIKALEALRYSFVSIKKTKTEEDEFHALAARIREAFTMNRIDLQIRPVIHRRLNRIKGHACICFAALAILAELERMLKAVGDSRSLGIGAEATASGPGRSVETAGSWLSLDEAVEAIKTIYRMNYISPTTGRSVSALLQLDATQRAVYEIVNKFT